VTNKPNRLVKKSVVRSILKRERRKKPLARPAVAPCYALTNSGFGLICAWGRSLVGDLGNRADGTGRPAVEKLYYCAMATYPLLTLLAQAMLAVPLVLLFLFGGLFCSVYIVLILVNAVGALVNGYRRKPPQLVLSRRAMISTALVAAALICLAALCSIDGRFT
jgi:hypothetical protein